MIQHCGQDSVSLHATFLSGCSISRGYPCVYMYFLYIVHMIYIKPKYTGNVPYLTEP